MQTVDTGKILQYECFKKSFKSAFLELSSWEMDGFFDILAPAMLGNISA